MKQNHNKNIIELSKHTIQPYIGLPVTRILLENINRDLEISLNKYLQDHIVKETDFPIEFANHMGEWKLNSDGKCLFKPKYDNKYITVDFLISNDENEYVD